mmetsp:Transcript_22378/g.53480  ORF Transcript_22378/g.53480 Transcript_22378/m.53480 type:complete len:206 (-) Transcript_22378:10-627(-)
MRRRRLRLWCHSAKVRSSCVRSLQWTKHDASSEAPRRFTKRPSSKPSRFFRAVISRHARKKAARLLARRPACILAATLVRCASRWCACRALASKYCRGAFRLSAGGDGAAPSSVCDISDSPRCRSVCVSASDVIAGSGAAFGPAPCCASCLILCSACLSRSAAAARSCLAFACCRSRRQRSQRTHAHDSNLWSVFRASTRSSRSR